MDQFCFGVDLGGTTVKIGLFTVDGIIEAICWNSSFSKYQDLIKKGGHVAILGNKKEDKLIVGKIKDLEHNRDLTRLDAVTDKDRKRSLKYWEAIRYLEDIETI